MLFMCKLLDIVWAFEKGHMQNYNVPVYVCVCQCVNVWWPVRRSNIAGNNRALSAKEAIIIKSKAQLKCHPNKIPYRIAFRSWCCRFGGCFFDFANNKHLPLPQPHRTNKIEPHIHFPSSSSSFFHTHKIRNLDLCMLFYRTLKNTHIQRYTRILHTLDIHTIYIYVYRPRHT